MADRVEDSSPATLNLRRLERIQGFLQYAAVLVLLVFVALIVVSYFQLRRIRREIADQQTLLDKRRLEIKDLEQTLESVKKQIEAQTAVLRFYSEKSFAASVTDPGKGVDTQKGVESSLPQVSDARQLPARIYLHIARENQRGRAESIAPVLQAAGFIVPSIVSVREGPNNSQLRYCEGDNFLPEDLDAITNALERISVSVKRQPISQCRNVRPRHYEIWLGENY